MCVRDGGGGRQDEAGGADGSAQPKTRTPHKDVGNKRNFNGTKWVDKNCEIYSFIFSRICFLLDS